MIKLKDFLLYIVIVSALLLFAYMCWNVARSVNYKFSYQDMVQETVRGMVKPEALK